ncbi:hypothetical protein [Frigoriglobus tundricola]|uniref:Uncharacterized protein n=1 Tax=Frigoriglobus tundricola TaxID=2774151 RepID=A0A6M5YPN6_9BACT|nr:hypothetical protein [Frigoriglobus tundricola]QJW94932.1 hypothetical protein FTUN_2458 [Frigoriglobus tundricola]
MLDRERAPAVRALLALSLLLLAAAPAFAYGGPGAGVEFIGYFMALLAWLGMCVSAVFLWPIYALIRKIRGRKNPSAQELPRPRDAAQPAETVSVEK